MTKVYLPIVEDMILARDYKNRLIKKHPEHTDEINALKYEYDKELRFVIKKGQNISSDLLTKIAEEGK